MEELSCEAFSYHKASRDSNRAIYLLYDLSDAALIMEKTSKNEHTVLSECNEAPGSIWRSGLKPRSRPESS